MMQSSLSPYKKSSLPSDQSCVMLKQYLNYDNSIVRPTHILGLTDVHQVESAENFNPLARPFSCYETDLSSVIGIDVANLSTSLLDPFADRFEPNLDSNCDSSRFFGSDDEGILNPLASIFVPSAISIDRLTQGNCVSQSQIHEDESDVLNTTPCVFDTDTPDLSMNEDEIIASNSTRVNTFTFLTMFEFGAYAFIFMISLLIIKGIFTCTSVTLSEPSLLLGNGIDTLNDRNARSDIDIDINETDDPKSLLEKLKAKNTERPIIAHININFLNPKFEPLKDIIKDNVDILLVSETKLDHTFPDGQFFIEGYKEPIRLDRNKNGGGLLFFIHDDLDSKEIKSHKLTKKNRRYFY